MTPQRVTAVTAAQKVVQVTLPPLRVTQEQPAYFPFLDTPPCVARQEDWPIFIHHGPGVYGLTDPCGEVKVGVHGTGPVCDPDRPTFTPESRVLLRRNIVERVQILAPFLSFDRDPYIVADSDHYSYILDAYTTSQNYPYSEEYEGSLWAFHGKNYLRNSVKAVVDAYNGSVTFYVFDRHDPIKSSVDVAIVL